MKKLTEMSLQELWQLFPIILKEHNPDYTLWYKEQEEHIIKLLGFGSVCRISHIGSTSVRGLAAKPVIDILAELPADYDMIVTSSVLENSGWLVMAENSREKTIDLNKGYTPEGFAQKVYHLHIKPSGDWSELYFRDYLQKYPSAARRYEELKMNLAEKFRHDRDSYTDAKSDFIDEYSQKARSEFPGRYIPADAKEDE